MTRGTCGCSSAPGWAREARWGSCSTPTTRLNREGAVGFADPTLPNLNIILSSARNQALNNVPAAFLRTLIHEAGHAFNLFHPKHDVHSPAIGTTIMNQTSDVVGFATAANPYPCNATFDFNEHNRTSLIHSPDPQVKPGWKEFGWGSRERLVGPPGTGRRGRIGAGRQRGS